MANPNRPSGFRPVKTLTGAPWTSMVRTVGVTSGTDIFIGDALSLVSNLARVMVSAETTMLGVAIGFGKIDKGSGEFAGAYNPDNLTTLHYDAGASTSTDWRVWYLPFDEILFEVQSSADLDANIGDIVDLDVTVAGNTVTGRSGQQVGAGTTDFRVVEIPSFPNNDPSLTNTRYWITPLKTKSVWQ